MGKENLAIKALLLLEKRKNERKMFRYKPYGHPDTLCPDGKIWKEGKKKDLFDVWSNKPWQVEFFAAGATHQERMLIAANRVGKTDCASYETAFHATGRYPEWWQGKRFDKPVLIWTGSPTNETSRDIVQKALIGGTDKENFGTGTIPKEYLNIRPKMRQAGVSDVVDTVKVTHITGGISTIVLKTYEQGWRKWQGTAPHVVWMDEEPEDNELQGRIRTEALTRLLTSHGIMMVTFTPLLGVTALVEHFQSGGEGIYLDTATWEDAPHLLVSERERLASSYPAHERDARTKGVPMMGEGRVFTTPEEDITVFDFKSEPWYTHIKGIDFGIDHPWAVADIEWDRDRDIIYVTRVIKKKSTNPVHSLEEHAEAINDVDPWVPVSWPHDGTNKEKSNGKRLRDNYIPHGVRLLSRSACYKNDKLGGQPVEPIIQEIDERCKNGGFKVVNTCTAFFDEYRNYHRKDGKLTKTRDDALKAVFYGVMMKRYGSTQRTIRTTRREPARMIHG